MSLVWTIENLKELFMAIVRVTVRTFQNSEHAELFIHFGKTVGTLVDTGLKVNFTMAQSETQKNQVVSIWQYDDESHMKAVRKKLSSLNKLPNSLMPKEIAYEAKVVYSLTS